MTPIIKWAGGKRQLLPALMEGMPDFPGRYVEPFFGSGALFFELQPKKAIINDYNDELINMYCQIRDNCDGVKGILDIYQKEYNQLNTKEKRAEYYYSKRDEFNSRMLTEAKNEQDAALFIFLNKSCYNGLYRVNGQGYFNTPTAKREKLNLYEPENINMCSEVLSNTKILQGDFSEACKGLRKGDFVYFDSPYYDTFDSYQAGGFPPEAHKRLAELFYKLSSRGIFCMLSNSDSDFIKELYSSYNISIVPVKRMINCDGSNRTGTEVIVRNFRNGELL